ncbi:MAG: rhamnulose-1-phosphate aldolase [Bacteroidales bacterium]|jgi:rhamnulose-1-phosphate aldolase
MVSILDINSKLTARIVDIAEVAGYLWQRGWAERNGGNISVNVTELMTTRDIEREPISTISLPKIFPFLADNFFYVTGTNRRMRYVSQQPMENGVIIRINDRGDSYDIIADNDIKPTSEILSHLSIHNYMKWMNKNSVPGTKEVKVVCHTHPTDLIALTHNPKFLKEGVLTHLLWSMIPETRVIVPHGIGIVPYEQPGTMELADATIKLLDRYDCVMWEKHGCLVIGDDIIEVFDMIDTLSKSAQIYLNAKMAGFEPEGLTKEQLDGLVPLFGIPEQ